MANADIPAPAYLFNRDAYVIPFVVEPSLPSGSPALMRSKKLFIASLFSPFEKTFFDRAQFGAFAAEFNQLKGNAYA
jgi:hypothetical protein